jgi:thiol-disulfide isomerase/thioredoxin
MKRISIATCCLLAALTACREQQSSPAGAAKTAPPAEARGTTTGNHESTTVPEVGSAMPEYSGKGLDGSTFSIKNELGRVVLLNMWATWCGPCRAEIPVLQALQGKYGAKGFKVIGVSLDDSSAQSTVRDFVRDRHIAYPVVLDPDGNLANMFQATVIPTSVLVDRQGKILWRQVGALPENDSRLIAAIERALGSKS